MPNTLEFDEEYCCKCHKKVDRYTLIAICNHIICQQCVEDSLNKISLYKVILAVNPSPKCPIEGCFGIMSQKHIANNIKGKEAIDYLANYSCSITPGSSLYAKCSICLGALRAQPCFQHNCTTFFCTKCLSEYIIYFLIKIKRIRLLTHKANTFAELEKNTKSILLCPAAYSSDHCQCEFTGDDFKEILKPVLGDKIYPAESGCDNCGKEIDTIELKLCSHKVCVECLRSSYVQSTNGTIKCPLSFCQYYAYYSNLVAINDEIKKIPSGKCDICGVGPKQMKHTCNFGFCRKCFIKYASLVVGNGEYTEDKLEFKQTIHSCECDEDIESMIAYLAYKTSQKISCPFAKCNGVLDSDWLLNFI